MRFASLTTSYKTGYSFPQRGSVPASLPGAVSRKNVGRAVPAVSPANRHDRKSQLTMKIPRGAFQAEPSEESSSGGTGVSPVNDGQSRGTRDRPTNTGQSPEDRRSQAEPGNEKEKAQ
jgi:hypothetical protein